MPDQSQPKRALSPHWEAIDASLLRYTYDSDQAIYPAPSLTYDRLRSWVESYPELCIVLRRGDGQDDSQPQVSSGFVVSDFVLGAVIVVPLLRKYWVQLVAEDPLLQEHDVDLREMFPSRADTEGSARAEVGLHVFHIERFPGFMKDDGTGHGFTQLVLEEVGGRVGAMFPSWSIIGYSALTVTSDGNRAFRRSGFSPTFTTPSEGEKIEMMVRLGA